MSNLIEQLNKSEEQYKVVGISTGHLTVDDSFSLDKLSSDCDCNIVMGRSTGWFIKLYDQKDQGQAYHGMSIQFITILNSAYEAGFRMVEFDSAANRVQGLEIFD
jgi:hypothetical protein